MTPSGSTEAALADLHWLRGFALRLASDRDDADDLVQETLVAAWSRPPEHAEASARPWLVAVLRNRLSMLRRADARRGSRERAAAEPSTMRAEGPHGELERLEVLRCLLAQLEALTPEDKMIVVRRFFDGEDATEIGRALAMPAATVRSRLHRSLQRLRNGLDQRFGDRRNWCVALGLVPEVGGEQAANTTGATTMSITVKGLIAAGVIATVGGTAWALQRDDARTIAPAVGDDGGTPTAAAERTSRVASDRRVWEDRRARIRKALPHGAPPRTAEPERAARSFRGLVDDCLDDLDSTANGALTLQVTEIGAPDVGVIYDDVVIVEQTLDDEAVLTCVTESMYGFIGDAPAEAYERVSQRTMQIGDSVEPDVQDQRMFDAIVGAHIGEVRHCQGKGPAGAVAEGTLSVAVTFGPDQLASAIEVVDNTLPAEIETCILGALQRWMYPKALDGKTLEYGFALPLPAAKPLGRTAPKE